MTRFLQGAKALAGAGVILLVFPALAPPSEARGNPDALLRGEYFLSLSQSCANGQFDEDTLSREVSDASATLSITGLLTYHGDGTGSFQGKQLLILHSLTTNPVRQDSLECDVAYAVGADRRVDQEFACKSKVLAGGPPPVGTEFEVQFALEGQVGKGRQTVVFGDSSPTIEILPPPVFQRICGNTGAAQKIRSIHKD